MSDYDFPKWEFEQSFVTSAGGTTPLFNTTVKERGVWRVTGRPDVTVTYTHPTTGEQVVCEKAGTVTISKKQLGGSWLDVYVISNIVDVGDLRWMCSDNTTVGIPVDTAALNAFLPQKNDMLGSFIYLPDYGDGSTPTIIFGSATQTFALTIDQGSHDGGQWDDMTTYQLWTLRAGATSSTNKGSAVAISQHMEMLNGITHQSSFFRIPKYFAIPDESGEVDYRNDISIEPIISGGDGKVRVPIAWDGGYAWAFTVSNNYLNYNNITITRIDPWHYSGERDFGTNERLTYHYWFDNHQDMVIPNAGSVVVKVYAPSVTGLNNASVTKWYDHFYLAPSDSIIYAINWDKKYVTSSIETPTITISTEQTCFGPKDITEKQSILSNICAASGNLFFTSKQTTGSDQQRLWRYNIASKTWSYTILPGREQARPRHIVDGLDGYVWITNYNNHSIIKANSSTGAIVATLRVSRHPYQMAVNESKELFVASDSDLNTVARKFYAPSLANGRTTTSSGGITGTGVAGYKVVITRDVTNGQVSIVNQTTDAVDAYCAGTCKSMDISAFPDGKFVDDGRGHLWFMDKESFGRLTKSDLSMKIFYPEPTDATEDADSGGWKDDKNNIYLASDLKDMIPGNATINHDYSNALSIAVTPQFIYQRWNGAALEDTIVKPYMIWTQNGQQFKFMRLSALVGKPKYEHTATAMIATGAQAYIGDGNL